MTFEEMVEEARKTVRERARPEIEEHLPDALYVDVREAEEWDAGHIAGALHLPLGSVGSLADPDSPSAIPQITARRTKPIVLYCETGRRSLLAGKVLHDLGYRNVVSLKGGYTAWKMRRD